jgi:protocatechuate 3,4-dioxygenase beta subunit
MSHQAGIAEKHNLHGGLTHDLERARQLNRRRALGLLGAAGTAALLTGCGGEESTAGSGTTTGTATPTPTSTATSSGGSSSACTTYAQETNGPYPADGTNQSRGTTSNVLTIAAFQRTDIRSSVLGSTTIADGVEMTFTITLVDVNNSCAALEGYAIYVWHCDAEGEYSLYDKPAEDFLRGIQVTDSNGQVTFTTIVPGCYNGRYPHIHFEVFSSLANATSANYAVLISQFAIPKDVLATVYAGYSAYSSSINALNNTSVTNDNVFGDNTSDQQEAMTVELSGSVSAGYTATATVGIAT